MDASKIRVSITNQLLDITPAFSFVADPLHGAVSSFMGVVRNHNRGRIVTGISYDIFEPLAINLMKEICTNVFTTFGGRIYLSHFKGYLKVGEVSVVIAVSTPHRNEAFSACRQIIEDLKHKVPIWKQEHYIDGASEWVKGHALCAHG